MLMSQVAMTPIALVVTGSDGNAVSAGAIDSATVLARY